MNIVDLFSGTGSATGAFREAGDNVVSVEILPSFKATIHADIRTVRGSDIRRHLQSECVHFLWASPPCQGFSIASVGRYWKMTESGPVPKHPKAELSLDLVRATLRIIHELKPRYWIMENPRGMLRKMPIVQGIERHTITYCAYGENRMKPTDLWGLFPPLWKPRPMCSPGDTCHEAAPRGSKTGTQGIKSKADRSRVAPELSISLRQAICHISQ